MDGFNEWLPRPDPALAEQPPPGVRVHRHEQGQLHEWVFLQHQIWIDYWGNEHEIEMMSRDYIENVIAYCTRRAETIRKLVMISAAFQLDSAPETRQAELRAHLQEASEVPLEELLEWLAELPLLRALIERSRTLESRGPN